MSSLLKWSKMSASVAAQHAKKWRNNTIQPGRASNGLSAVWQAWNDVKSGYTFDWLPLHSKCIGFAYPSTLHFESCYYAVYRMDKASLAQGIYQYGQTPMIGWPKNNDGAYQVYDSPDATASWYQWSGDYNVEQRPWFVQGRKAKMDGSFTKPYHDPVTNELIVSYVKAIEHGGVVIVGTWLEEDVVENVLRQFK